MTPTWPDPDRLDALVDGATPATDEEAALHGLFNELRGDGARAPQALRARVEGLAASGHAPRRRWSWRPAWPALAGALAPVMAAAAIAVAAWPASSPTPRQDLEQTQPFAAKDAAAPPSPKVDARSTPAPTGTTPAASTALSAGASVRESARQPVRPARGRRWPYILGLTTLSVFLAIGFGWSRLRRSNISRV